MTQKKEDGKPVTKTAPEAKAPEAQKVGTNPLKLPWPTDPQGQVHSLKKGGVEAAKRVNGDPDRLKKLVKTLRIIEAHAKERFEKDRAARQTAKTNAISAKARIEEKQRRQAEAKAKDLEQTAALLRKRAAK